MISAIPNNNGKSNRGCVKKKILKKNYINYRTDSNKNEQTNSSCINMATSSSA